MQPQLELPRLAIEPDPRIKYPRSIRNRPPRLPPLPDEAFRLGYEGIVGMLLFVEADGKVTRAGVGKSTGYKVLDDAALAVVSAWKLQPGRIDGVPTAMWSCWSTTFALTNEYRITPKDVEEMTAYNKLCTELKPKLPPLPASQTAEPTAQP